ncbi:PfkB family carbohydrate kinase, partial [Cytobacillus oceanisediminis]|uniref:PfkB family carbohydrate kinase n=1 Tax=Cytobacillus oceanisediminis TaxID=665099 RepID=UPI0021B63DEB
MRIEKEGEFLRAGEMMIDKGVEKVVIRGGDKGLMYFRRKGEGGVVIGGGMCVMDVSGGGDWVVAGIMYGDVNG